MLAASRLRPRSHNVSSLLIVIVAYGKAHYYSIVVQAVVYNLPERDCSAKASDGELHIDNAGESRYEAYVKAIYSEIKQFPDVSVVLIVEPDSIGNRMSQS
jgi:cellulose 1,4-beta-cellobiosidase